MAKFRLRRELPEIIRGIHARHPELQDNADILDTDSHVVINIVENIIKSTATSKKEAEQLRDTMSDIIQKVFVTYGLDSNTEPAHVPNPDNPRDKKDGYVALFRQIATAGLILPAQIRKDAPPQMLRLEYFQQIDREIKLDGSSLKAFSYQLVPRFATEILSKLNADGTPNQVQQALEYLKARRAGFGNQPAEKLINFAGCFGTTESLSYQQLRKLAEEGDPTQLFRQFGVMGISLYGNKPNQVTITGPGNNGRSPDYVVKSPSGQPFVDPIIRLLREAQTYLRG